MGVLNNLFGNKKEQEEQEKLGKAMQSLSDQIASLQQTNLSKDKEIDRLREELSELQAKASSASGMSKADLQKLQSALAVAEADRQANEMMMKNAQKQVADLQAQLKAMQEQAATAAPQHMGATEAPALSAGVTAWVRRAGGMNLRRRSGPSLSAHVVDGIAPGTQLTLVEGPVSADGHSWWNIRTADGREGWVAGEELVTSPE